MTIPPATGPARPAALRSHPHATDLPPEPLEAGTVVTMGGYRFVTGGLAVALVPGAMRALADGL